VSDDNRRSSSDNSHLPSVNKCLPFPFHSPATCKILLLLETSYSPGHIIFGMANMTLKSRAATGRTTAIPPRSPTVSDLDEVFKGFADPTRIRILSLLAAGELCVCDIVEILELPQPAVSRHLAYLRRTGLVEVKRDLKFAHYRLAAPEHAVHRNLISCVRTCFRGITPLDHERRKAEARVKARASEPC